MVNTPYAIISSSVSFWLPCAVMLFVYWRIYMEATKQEKMLYKSQMGPHPHSNHARSRGSSADQANRDHITVHAPPHRGSHDDPESGQSTPTKRSINKMKREHKAAKVSAHTHTDTRSKVCSI